LATRYELWQQSLTQFQKDPIFGQGAGHPLNPLYSDQLVTHSHNVLLDYLRTLGAPGFFGLVTLLLTILILSLGSIRLALKAQESSVRDRMMCIGLAMGALAYVFANFSSDSMRPSTSPLLWTVLFLGLSARTLVRAKGDEGRSPSRTQ